MRGITNASNAADTFAYTSLAYLPLGPTFSLARTSQPSHAYELPDVTLLYLLPLYAHAGARQNSAAVRFTDTITVQVHQRRKIMIIITTLIAIHDLVYFSLSMTTYYQPKRWYHD